MTTIDLKNPVFTPPPSPPTSPDVSLFLRGLHCGGAERAMINLADGFVNRGLNVDMVLIRAEGPYLEQLNPEVRVVDLAAQWKPFSVPKLAQYLKDVNPKTLIASLHYPCEIALWAKQLAGSSTRVMVVEHNTLSVEDKRSIHHLTPLMAKWFYPWADQIVAVSYGVADDLARVMGVGSDRIQVIYNPVLLPQVLTQAKEPVNHPWFAPGEPPVILGVGRLTPQKGFPTLIRAFARVRQTMAARLVILGEGPDLEQLQALAEDLGVADSVAFPGFLINPYAYMAKSAVFVMSSVYEGLGNVLIEAMGVGTPVISTDCKSGPSEILAKGKYGALTPVGDSEAIAQEILKVLKGETATVDPQWLDQFTLDACVQKYLDLLELA